MNSEQINNILSNDKYAKHVFKGCFPKDIPIINELKTPKRAYILNTSSQYEEGTHWIALYMNDTKCYIFDSLYSHNVLNDKYMRRSIFLLKKRRKLIRNKKRVQPLNSSTCGLYTLLFVLWMSRNYTYGSFLKLFTSYSLQENDKFICMLMKELYSHLHCNQFLF